MPPVVKEEQSSTPEPYLTVAGSKPKSLRAISIAAKEEILNRTVESVREKARAKRTADEASAGPDADVSDSDVLPRRAKRSSRTHQDESALDAAALDTDYESSTSADIEKFSAKLEKLTPKRKRNDTTTGSSRTVVRKIQAASQEVYVDPRMQMKVRGRSLCFILRLIVY